MTLDELKSSVAHLGAEKYIEAVDDTAEGNFLFAVTRAVYAVNRIRPRVSSVTINTDARTTDNSAVVVTVSESAITYDFRNLPDFMRFSGAPSKAWGEVLVLNRHYTISDERILRLHPTLTGEIMAEYETKLPQYTINTPTTSEIPLDEELCQLLPNLVAYYVFLDDDANKAAVFKQRYEELYNILSYRGKSRSAAYFSSNNW